VVALLSHRREVDTVRTRRFPSPMRSSLTEIYLTYATPVLVTKLRAETAGQALALGMAALTTSERCLHQRHDGGASKPPLSCAQFVGSEALPGSDASMIQPFWGLVHALPAAVLQQLYAQMQATPLRLAPPPPRGSDGVWAVPSALLWGR
jgi:hypothetical protein